MIHLLPTSPALLLSTICANVFAARRMDGKRANRPPRHLCSSSASRRLTAARDSEERGGSAQATSSRAESELSLIQAIRSSLASALSLQPLFSPILPPRWVSPSANSGDACSERYETHTLLWACDTLQLPPSHRASSSRRSVSSRAACSRLTSEPRTQQTQMQHPRQRQSHRIVSAGLQRFSSHSRMQQHRSGAWIRIRSARREIRFADTNRFGRSLGLFPRRLCCLICLTAPSLLCSVSLARV